MNDYDTPEDHKNALIDDFTDKWIAKYDKGQKEHGGRLWRKNCRSMLEEEVLDFVSYVGVMLPQLDEVENLLEQALYQINRDPGIARDKIKAALNVLRIGNKEGRYEEEL